MMMVLNRDYVHVSSSGLAIAFASGVPAHVPNRLVKEIIGIGGTAASEDKEAETAVLAQMSTAQAENAERGPKIEAAVRKMLEQNQRGYFTAGGRPNLKVLFGITGLEVSPQELDPIWSGIKATLQGSA